MQHSAADIDARWRRLRHAAAAAATCRTCHAVEAVCHMLLAAAAAATLFLPAPLRYAAAIFITRFLSPFAAIAA